MLIEAFESGPWGTNCIVLAPGPSSECVIVDPAKDSLGRINEIVTAFDLHPVAALLTHGHIDHTWSVVPLCEGHDIPAVIHADDRHQLDDPLSGLSREMGGVLGMMHSGLPMGEPREVRVVGDGDSVEIAGQAFTVRHAPGHTPGSIAYLTRDPVERADIMVSGDLLFAGSIGRTDLPGGSWDAMLDSLARVALPLGDDTIVLPGHGPATTIGRERSLNPYLAQAASAPPHRGL